MKHLCPASNITGTNKWLRCSSTLVMGAIVAIVILIKKEFVCLNNLKLLQVLKLSTMLRILSVFFYCLYLAILYEWVMFDADCQLGRQVARCSVRHSRLARIADLLSDSGYMHRRAERSGVQHGVVRYSLHRRTLHRCLEASLALPPHGPPLVAQLCHGLYWLSTAAMMTVVKLVKSLPPVTASNQSVANRVQSAVGKAGRDISSFL